MEDSAVVMKRFFGPVVSRYGSIAIQFLIVAIVTRSLPLSDAGLYFTIMGVVLSTYFFAGLGLPDGAVRVIPSQIAGSGSISGAVLLRRSYIVATLTLIPLGGLVGALSLVSFGQMLLAVAAATWWAAYGAIFVSAQFVVATGRGSFGTTIFYSFANFAQLLISVPLILVTGTRDLYQILALVSGASWVAALAAIIIATTSIRRELRLSPTSSSGDRGTSTIGATWRAGVPIAASRIVQAVLIWSPVGVASLILSYEAAAEIGLASRLVSAVAAVIAAIRFSIRPQYARDAAIGNWSAIRSSASRIALIATVFAVVSLVFAATAGQVLVPFIFGSTYVMAATLTAIMLFGTVGESIGGPVDEVLKMSGSAYSVLIVQSIALPLGLAGQFLGGLAADAFGLSAAYALTFILMYAAMIVILYRRHGVIIIPRWKG